MYCACSSSEQGEGICCEEGSLITDRVFFIAVKRQCDMEMLPLECHYLNKSALISVVGQQVMLCLGHLACYDS
jgi:hypothetical protein